MKTKLFLASFGPFIIFALSFVFGLKPEWSWNLCAGALLLAYPFCSNSMFIQCQAFREPFRPATFKLVLCLTHIVIYYIVWSICLLGVASLTPNTLNTLMTKLDVEFFTKIFMGLLAMTGLAVLLACDELRKPLENRE